MTAPAQPGASLTARQELGAIEVVAGNPNAGELAVTNEVWRRPAGGVAERLAIIGRDATFVDYTPASGVDYQYQVVAFSADGDSSASPWTGIRVARYNVTRLGASVFG